jgi:hypothetical protein
MLKKTANEVSEQLKLPDLIGRIAETASTSKSTVMPFPLV